MSQPQRDPNGTDRQRPGHGRRNRYAGAESGWAHVNPQDATRGTQVAPNRPRRAGQERIYQQYVPAQGDEPVQLRKSYGATPVPDAPVAEQPRRKGGGAVVAIACVVAVILAVGGFLAYRAFFPDGLGEQAEREYDSSASPFDDGSEDAIGVLTNDKHATDLDMSVLTMLFPAMGDEYVIISTTQPGSMSPDDVISKVMVSGWDTEFPGWDNLQLRVRAAGYAIGVLEEEQGDEYEVTTSRVYDTDPIESVVLTCKCMSGDNKGILVSVTVGVSGRKPYVVADVNSAISQKRAIEQRLASVIALRPDLYIGDFALEGSSVPQRQENGTTMRMENWWLYVNSNVAPQDLSEFTQFVNDMELLFEQTKPDDVVSIAVTVISCDANDPGLRGMTFPEFATEIATASDPGSRFTKLDPVLMGLATDKSPCYEDALDGRLHPWTWGAAEGPGEEDS